MKQTNSNPFSKTNLLTVGLVHIGKREKSGIQILEKLNQNSIEVKQWDVLSHSDTLQGIEDVNVVVVNIGETDFDYDDLLSLLFELDGKVIINEASLTNKLTGLKRQSWERHLLNKIDSSFSLIPTPDNQQNMDKPLEFNKFGVKSVWLLAASIGGPEAIAEFLSQFEGNEKCIFILIQHMDKEFLPMMAQQFSQNTKVSIEIPISGMKLMANTCYIHPTDEYLEFLEDGTLNLAALKQVFSFTPCIDEVSKKLVKNIKNLNIAVFSGMSTDGIKAATYIKEQQGKVITQTESTCVLSSIIQGVKKNIQIEFEGTPIEMAKFIKEDTNN